MAQRTLWTRFRRALLTGIVVIAPVWVTVFVLVWIFERLDSILGRYVRLLWGVQIPGLGLLALVVVLALVGWIAQRAVGRQVIGFWNSLLARLPFTRKLYNAASQIVQAVFAKDRRLLKGCVLIEYPRRGCWTIGFVTHRGAREICEAAGTDCVTVFLPTVPNPTTGYLLFLPVDDVKPLRMSIEDGFKLIISGGAVVPEGQAREVRGLDLERLWAEES